MQHLTNMIAKKCNFIKKADVNPVHEESSKYFQSCAIESDDEDNLQHQGTKNSNLHNGKAFVLPKEHATEITEDFENVQMADNEEQLFEIEHSIKNIVKSTNVNSDHNLLGVSTYIEKYLKKVTSVEIGINKISKLYDIVNL